MDPSRIPPARNSLPRLLCFCCFLFTLSAFAAEAKPDSDAPQVKRFSFRQNGVDREYFVRLPKDYDSSQTYWGLVAFHGGGGNGRTHWLVRDMHTAAAKIGLPVIVISPTGSRTDPNEQRFPSLGDGPYLRMALAHVKKRHRLHPKILLTGYSRGAQFAHRFALQNPALVHACAPLAAGSWTSPDGSFQMYSTPDKIMNAAAFLGDAKNAKDMPERQQELFVPLVAEAAGRRAAKGAESIHFLVMCGSEDVRLPSSKAFAKSLRTEGYQVETGWLKTPHGGRDRKKYAGEFQKYSETATDFFRRAITE